MSRRVLSRLFFGSLIAIVGALALLGVTAAVAVGSSSLVMNGPDVVGVESAFGWGLVAMAAVGALMLVAGAVGQLAAWIVALVTTAALEDNTWFVVLLVAGIFGFSFIALLVYLLVDSDRNDAGLRLSGTERPAVA
ncbi:MAG: hypothetical protein ABWZ69_01620 [Mycetocola sp.]